MECRRVVRVLRIATAAACVIACAFLIVFWARSYSWYEYAICPLSEEQVLHVASRGGQMIMHTLRSKQRPGNDGSILETYSHKVSWHVSSQGHSILGLRWRANYLAIPYWMLVLATGTLAALLSVRQGPSRRFSLRTLLLATTVVAFVLGMIAIAAR